MRVPIVVVVGIVGEQNERKVVVLSRQTEKVYIYLCMQRWNEIMEWNQELMLIFLENRQLKQLF